MEDTEELPAHFAGICSMEDTEDLRHHFEVIGQKEIEAFGDIVREHGAAAIPRELQQRLEKWKEIPLNVGITGVSGVGKSSFINAVRRLTPDDPSAAAVGVTETTIEPKSFEHPRNPKVLFWDLPGVGTPKFMKETYLEDVYFETYDFFIIICSDRFTENDLWLAKEIKKKGKHFYFARTKLDRSINDDKEDHPKTHNEEALIEKIRQDCTSQLSAEGFERPIVFLICKKPHLYDFPRLEETFIMEIPELKREVALYTIRGSTENIIREKTKMLLDRCWKVAALSAATAVVPVPGLSFAVDTTMIVNELKLYRQVYGLDDEALLELSSESGVSKQTLDRELQNFIFSSFSVSSVMKFLLSLSTAVLIQEAARFIPIIGSLIASPVSYAVTKRALEHSIAGMESAALSVIKVAISKASEV